MPSPPPPLPPVLAELVAYFEPFSTVRRDFRGAVTLHTPGINVLALNASYLPEDAGDVLPLVRAWHLGQDVPPLVASVSAVVGEDVGGLRVGTFAPVPDPGLIVVEQVSRLHLATWAGVLAESYGAAEWAETLARHFAGPLEGDPKSVLLMAYAGGEAIGSLLWRDLGGGAAHLWGTLDPAADAPLLNAAAELSEGEVRVSLPDISPLHLQNGKIVTFTLLP
ncbi:hypothetical protein E7T06_12910 [Deinococcus sp. Arct2-2]|uniref:hypothetical protein n=1 Tax=Deinococcus sp. Arct2-2 TaxID=2568653 RepID=UPI0010A32F24|nr:hypothetical protein [Deinococcus sp. Arct2-2]THF69274.1 hypothetical protein E7T06_12910 [Deinococcus sp. Arct2-2]